MNVTKFESLWNLMSKYSFEFELDMLNEDIKCSICNKEMADAYLSGCGCQYCHKCVSDYLSDGDKYCPGSNVECKEDYLVMERNVIRNKKANNKISRLRVQCPNELCEFQEELVNIEEHIRVCLKLRKECPYVNIGCDEKEGSRDSITNHLGEEVFSHSLLLIDYIQNIKNELHDIKEDSLNSKEEILSLREVSSIKEVPEPGEEIDVEMFRRDFVNSQIEKEELKKEIEVIKEEAKMKDENQKKEMEELRKEIEILKEAHMRNEAVKVLQNEEIRLLKESNEERGRCEEDRERRIDHLYRYNLGVDFLWKIKLISSNKGHQIFSEPFYSHKYKLCLCMYINRFEDDISVSCLIMKGDYDEEVEWPMRRAVTLSLLDQESLVPYTSSTMQYDTFTFSKTAFDRPTKERNDFFISEYYFVNYSSIKDNSSVTVDDSLLMTCLLPDI